MPRRRPKRLLFVCAGNTCRSPMAEHVFRAALGPGEAEGLEVVSAGLWALEGAALSAEAEKVLRQRGIDASAHRARQLSAEELQQADMVIVMTAAQRDAVVKMLPQAAEKVFMLGEFDPNRKQGEPARSIDDPAGGDLEDYERCIEEIESCVAELKKFVTSGREA